jgi:hypothetical protein
MHSSTTVEDCMAVILLGRQYALDFSRHIIRRASKDEPFEGVVPDVSLL